MKFTAFGETIYILIYYILYKFYQFILWKILMKFRRILTSLIFYFAFLFFANDRGMKTKDLNET